MYSCAPMEIGNQLEDLEEQYYSEQENGTQICPICGKDVPHEKMTASVSRGIVCWDCDNEMS